MQNKCYSASIITKKTILCTIFNMPMPFLKDYFLVTEKDCTSMKTNGTSWVVLNLWSSRRGVKENPWIKTIQSIMETKAQDIWACSERSHHALYTPDSTLKPGMERTGEQLFRYKLSIVLKLLVLANIVREVRLIWRKIVEHLSGKLPPMILQLPHLQFCIIVFFSFMGLVFIIFTEVSPCWMFMLGQNK